MIPTDFYEGETLIATVNLGGIPPVGTALKLADDTQYVIESVRIELSRARITTEISNFPEPVRGKNNQRENTNAGLHIQVIAV